MNAPRGNLEAACREIAKNTCSADVWRYRVEDWFICRRTTGGTVDQCHKDMQMLYGFEIEKNSIAPRVTELKSVRPGEPEPRLYPTGETRLTRSGKPAVVYAHRTFFKPANKNPQQTLFGGAA